MVPIGHPGGNYHPMHGQPHSIPPPAPTPSANTIKASNPPKPEIVSKYKFIHSKH